MAAFEHTVVVDGRADAVFAVLADLGSDPRWRREWVDARADTPGPLGVGSRTTLVGKALGRRLELVRLVGPVLGWMGRRQLVGDLPALGELLAASAPSG